MIASLLGTYLSSRVDDVLESDLSARRILRASWNRSRMDMIKAAYVERYAKTLEARIKSETSGEYRTLLLALVGTTSEQRNW